MLKKFLIAKRPEWVNRHGKVILLHDNAQAHTSKGVKRLLKDLSRDVLTHPPYSPDLASSVFYLFRLMAHALAEQHSKTYEDVQKLVSEWFALRLESSFGTVFINYLKDGKMCSE